MAMTPSQVHQDQILTNLTVAYLQSQTNFIADQVFPRVSVDKQSDKYYVYPKGQFNRVDEVKKIAPGQAVEEMTMTVSTDNYFADVYGLGFSLTEQMLADEDRALDIRSAAVFALTNKLLLKRENDWMTTYFAPGVWSTQKAGVAAAPGANQVFQWSDYTNSTPIVDIINAKRDAFLLSGGFEPNVMVVTRDVRDMLINHPDVLARLNGGATVTNTALVTNSKLAEIFEVSKFLVVNAIQNTGKEGLADANSFVATKKAALYYAPQNPGLMVPATGYNFVWGAGAGADFGVTVNSYTGTHLAERHIAEKVEALMAYDMKVISADMGIFWNTIIA